MEMKHVYIHIPFCNGRCTYCAAYAVPYQDALFDRYETALWKHLDGMAERIAAGGLDTVYLGGGTPTVMSATRLARFLDGVCERLPLNPLTEFSAEAAPDTLSPDKAHILAAHRVNRVSIGVQSMDDAVLRNLGRRHDRAAVYGAVAAARQAGIENLGLDLIAGLPGIDAACWRRSLDSIIELAPAHVSVYALSIEPGTALEHARQTRHVHLPTESTVMRSLATTTERLRRAGLAPYEVSNYARPGKACRHNLACWRGYDYLGAGPSAASRSMRKRWTNVADVEAYAARLEQGLDPAAERETVDPVTDCTERLLFAFRLHEGVILERYVTLDGKPGAALRGLWQATARSLATQGLLTEQDGRWRLTPRGFEVADSVLTAFLP